jgi:hypothetical protein
MTRSSWLPAAVIAASALLLPTTRPAVAEDSPCEDGIMRLDVSGNGGTSEGTAFLVRVDHREHDVVAYFLTSAHLFGVAAVGSESTVSMHVLLTAKDGSTIARNAADVAFPAGLESGIDVAVLKITAPSTSLVPVPLALAPPQVGQVFTIRAPLSMALPVSPERVRFLSGRLVTGDRAVVGGDGLIGAPAMTADGAFGVVSHLGANRVPIIALLSAARNFLNRAIPGWTAAPATTRMFELERRVVNGPLITVACGATSSGDLDVPLPISPREGVVDADATFTSPRSIRLGDLTVLSLSDRSVKLHFTVGGVIQPMFPAPCLPGQALVTIRINLLVVPR